MGYVCIGSMIYPGSLSFHLIVNISASCLHFFFVCSFFSPKIVNPLKNPVTWGCHLIKMCMRLAGHRVIWNAGIADSFAKLQNNPVSYQKIRTVQGFQVPVWLVYTFCILSCLMKCVSSSSLFTVLTAKICHCSIWKGVWGSHLLIRLRCGFLL